MTLGKPHTPPVTIASAQTARATTNHAQPASGLLYQVLSALAWNG